MTPTEHKAAIQHTLILLGRAQRNALEAYCMVGELQAQMAKPNLVLANGDTNGRMMAHDPNHAAREALVANQRQCQGEMQSVLALADRLRALVTAPSNTTNPD